MPSAIQKDSSAQYAKGGLPVNKLKKNHMILVRGLSVFS